MTTVTIKSKKFDKRFIKTFTDPITLQLVSACLRADKSTDISSTTKPTLKDLTVSFGHKTKNGIQIVTRNEFQHRVAEINDEIGEHNYYNHDRNEADIDPLMNVTDVDAIYRIYDAGDALSYFVSFLYKDPKATLMFIN